MPMQLARCPECGEHVGGQNHAAVAGVTRATEMEQRGTPATDRTPPRRATMKGLKFTECAAEYKRISRRE
jgi:hypothetical protein